MQRGWPEAEKHWLIEITGCWSMNVGPSCTRTSGRELITDCQRRSTLELCSLTSVIHYLRNTLRRLRHPVPG